MSVSSSILNLIGNTPIVELTHTPRGISRLFVKLESQNPGGSIKDRVGLSLITVAEKEGKLKPGGTIIEATAGNTGIGLALVARLKGYKLILVIPDKMSQEKINHLRALDVEVVLTRSDVGKGHPEYYQDLAQKIANERGAFFVNQFENPANPLAHETTTAPEIWEQLEHDVDAIVLGVGSSGTLTGISKFFKKVSPKTEIILADPEGSILADYINKGILRTDAGSWFVEGIGEDFIPSIADFSLTHKAYSISDQESFDAVRNLLRDEGILAGSSSGTLLAAAIKYASEQTEPKRIVTLVCDSGNKYLSKQFNDTWLFDQGFANPTKYGDLRDVAVRRIANNTILSARPDETIRTIYNRFRLHGISQIPVLDNGKTVGVVDESDILLALWEKRQDITAPISSIMSTTITCLPYSAPLKSLPEVLNKGFVVILEDNEGNFDGLITRIDFINYINTHKVW